MQTEQLEAQQSEHKMAKTNAVWGIDIGQCALKALRCTLDADGSTIVADKYDIVEYPKILSATDADPEELVADAIQQFLSRNEVVGDKVAVSVAGQAVCLDSLSHHR